MDDISLDIYNTELKRYKELFNDIIDKILAGGLSPNTLEQLRRRGYIYSELMEIIEGRMKDCFK